MAASGVDVSIESTSDGTVSMSGQCSGQPVVVSAGSNDIKIAPLTPKVYSDCLLTFTDSEGNESTPLKLNEFTIPQPDPENKYVPYVRSVNWESTIAESGGYHTENIYNCSWRYDRKDISGCTMSDISIDGEIDEWTFNGLSGQWVEILMDAAWSGGLDPILELVAPNDPHAANIELANLVPENPAVSVDSDISCFYGFCSAGEIEAGEIRGNSISEPKQTDDWQYMGTAGEVIRIVTKIMPGTELMPLLLEAFGPSNNPEDCYPYTFPECPGANWTGSVLEAAPVTMASLYNFSEDGAQRIDKLVIRQTGPHIIRVKGLGYSTPVYTLQVDSVSTAPNISERPDILPAGSVGSLIVYGETRGAEISVAAEVDSYLFYGIRGESVVISMEPDEEWQFGSSDCYLRVACIDPFIELISPNGVTEVFSNKGPGSGSAVEIDLVFVDEELGGGRETRPWVLQETGWYTINARALGGSGAYDWHKKMDRAHLYKTSGPYTISLNQMGTVVVAENVEPALIGRCPADLPLADWMVDPHPNCVALTPYRPGGGQTWPSFLGIRHQLEQDGVYTVRARGIADRPLFGENIGNYRLEIYISDTNPSATPGSVRGPNNSRVQTQLESLAGNPNDPPLLKLQSEPDPITFGESKRMDSDFVVPFQKSVYNDPRNWFDWDYGIRFITEAGVMNEKQPHVNGGYLSFQGTSGQRVNISVNIGGNASVGVELISPNGISEISNEVSRCYIAGVVSECVAIIHDYPLKETGLYRIKAYRPTIENPGSEYSSSFTATVTLSESE